MTRNRFESQSEQPPRLIEEDSLPNTAFLQIGPGSKPEDAARLLEEFMGRKYESDSTDYQI